MELIHPDYLVQPDWLAAHLRDPAVRVLDVTAKLTSKLTNRAREECYDVAHIPGAQFVDVGGGHGEFHDPDAELPWTWPSPERFTTLMNEFGITNASRVVLVAATPRPGIDSGTMWCTRAWWTMHHFGVDCAILAGGMERWVAQGRPVAATDPPPPADPGPPAGGAGADAAGRTRPGSAEGASFRVAPGWERGRAGSTDVLDALRSEGACVLDSLAADSFSGEAQGYGPRPGHITGARNLPFRTLVAEETAAFHDPATLRAELEGQGLFDHERVVTYCGGAIAATTTAFALALFGHPDVAVYDGSLMEWAADPALPMTDPGREPTAS